MCHTYVNGHTRPQDHRDSRTTSRSVETSLREYLLKTGWSSGLFCGGYEESLHGQTGSVFGFHLLLQQSPRTSASGGRNAAVLPSLSSLRASDDPDTRNARPHRDRKSTRLNSSHGYISYAVF